MSKTPPPVLTLITGPEDFLAERAVDEVFARAKAIDKSAERRVVDVTEPGSAGLITEACSPTLFGGAAVVVIENAEQADDSCLKAIKEAVADPADGVAIIALHAAGAKGKKILDALRPLAGETVDCSEIKKGRGIADFVNGEVRRHRKTMSPEAQSMLIAAVGSDTRALAAACAQLSSDIEAKDIDADSVTMYFGGAVDITGFQIADAVMNKQGAAALRLLRLAEGADGSRLGPATVASLANSVRQIVAVAAAPAGMSDRDLALEAKVPPWKVKSLQQQARRWNPADIARAVILLSDLDAAVKGGLRDGDQIEPSQKGLALEQTVVRLGQRKAH